MAETFDIWKDYDAKTKYPDVTAYILKLIRENKKVEEKLEAVEDWWLLFNQCIDSDAAKEKLEEILKGPTFECRDEVFTVEAS